MLCSRRSRQARSGRLQATSGSSAWLIFRSSWRGEMAVKGTRVGPTLTRRELLELLGVTGAAAALAACAPSSSGGPSSSATASAAAGTPQRGGSVTVALTSNITTLDPRIAGTNNALRLVTHT